MTDEDAAIIPKAWEFTEFVRQLVSTMHGATLIERNERSTAGLVDVVATVGSTTLLVEAKAQTPQTSQRLQSVVAQLRRNATSYQDRTSANQHLRLVIAVPGVISSRKAAVLPTDIELWDGQFLRTEARRQGIKYPPFLAALDEEGPAEDRAQTEDLALRLSRIAPGPTDWPQYEKFCEDALNFLFCPPLNPALPQSRNENGVNRRDFVQPNYASEGFWTFMRLNYHADYVVAEAKNYAAPVRESEILQLANYLTRHGTGLMGLLMTRNGLAQDAWWTSREQWLLHDKLIVGLEDEDLSKCSTQNVQVGTHQT